MLDMFGAPVGPSLPPLPWGTAGQPSTDPMAQQRVAQQVEALRSQMQQREQMRYGMPGPQDPRVGAMMQELESRLGGGPQWRDTTGLGGRMSRLPMPQEQQAPQGPQQDPGLLLQALQLAARNSGQLSPNNVMRGPGGTYHGDVIDSSGPMQGEDWYPEYIAAAQGGADLPMIRGNAQPFSEEAKAGMAARRQERLRDTLPMAERSANVRSNAIAKSAARHGRMGIGDNSPQMDLLQRLQQMEGGSDPMGAAGYVRNRMMGGPQFAGAAFQGAQQGALQDQELRGRAEMEQMKLMYAAAISVLQNPLATPQEKQQAWQMIQGGGAGGMPMAPPEEPSPFLPDRPVNQQPMKAWQGPGTNPATLMDTLEAFGGMSGDEVSGAMAKAWPWNMLPQRPGVRGTGPNPTY